MTNYNKALTSLEISKEEINKKIKNGIIEATITAFNKIDSLKSEYNIKERKAISLLKKETLHLDNDKPCKYLNRAYNIAFGYIKRGFKANDITSLCEVLTPSQLEQLVRHATIADIQEIIICDIKDIEDEAKRVLKSLKTREITVKTFEKTSR